MEILDSPEEPKQTDKRYWLKLALTVIGCYVLMFVSVYLSELNQPGDHISYIPLFFLLGYPIIALNIGILRVSIQKNRDVWSVGLLIYALSWILIGVSWLAL